MQRTPVTKEIDGLNITVIPMPPRKALRVMRKIGAVMGYLAGAAPGASPAERFGAACSGLSDEQMDHLCDGLLYNVKCGEKQLKGSEDEMITSVATLIKVLWFSGEVNFGEAFRDDVAGLGGPAAAPPR